jgi:hypothetical protein
MWCSTRWPAEAVRRAARPAALAAALSSTLVLTLTLALPGGVQANTAAPAAPGGAAAGASALASGHPQLPGSRLQGQATLRYWGLRVYQARLWTPPDFRPERATDQPLALELQYLLDLGGKAIAERSLQEMRRAASIEPAQAERWLAAMQRLFPDVKSGERLTGVLQPGKGVRFWHNDRLVGEVPDPEFARLFFGIWLAPTTSEPDMRLALLGLRDAGPR